MDRTDMDSRLDTISMLFAPFLLTPNCTEELLKKMQELITSINWSPEGVVNLFVALLKRFESKPKDGRPELLIWMMKMLNCIQMNYITPSWRCPNGKTVIELVQDSTVTDETLQKHLNDDREKTLDEILEEIQQQNLNHIDKKLLQDVKEIVSAVDKGRTFPFDRSKKSEMIKMLQKLCKAAEQIYFRPRLTQMVSWCLMALSKNGQLLQIATGEGKSCTVAMFAAFRALKGEKVDIMSSSSVLAERDFEEWEKFYKTLKISVSCNINKQSSDLKKCYKSQIVYGTVEQFAGDWLQHHFQRMDIFGQRKFQCAIVDEVDSLMLDKGHHTVYIGNNMPALQHLNPLLACIWATANKYTSLDSGEFVGQKHPFHQVILENITAGRDTDEFTILQLAEDTGVLPKGSVWNLRENPSLLAQKTANISVTQLANFFKTVERRFKSSQFALYCTDEGKLKEITTPQNGSVERKKVQILLNNGGLCQYVYADKESLIKAAEAEVTRVLHFTPCELNQGQNTCQVPGFLKDLVNAKLKAWIENAFYAQTLKKDHEYILEVHGVVPVDYSCTGVVENFRQWTDGLHQFLEMKHQCKLSDMTAITNYMSNVGLLQMYGDQIYGVTGTLGQGAETETLQRIYEGITTCQIPTFKRRKLFEVEGVVVYDEEQWVEKICSVVKAQISPTKYRKERAVLVICETIGRAKAVHDALGNTVKKTLYTNNNMDNTQIFSEKLEAGHVIVATNLAGRGADLRVSDQVKASGGLFVVQTFLPKNARVEAQAFGRTARQGAPGCAQLIVCSDHLPALLQLLALINGLGSLLERVFNFTGLYQNRFKRQFRLYQHGLQDSRGMCHTLSHILTETSDSGIKLVKKIRDHCVAEELANYLQCHIPMIKKKGELFSHYLGILGDFYTSNNNKPAESDLSALNEVWGMWLLTNFNENDPILDLKTKLTVDLELARQKLGRRESPFANVHHYTLFGNELHKLGRHEDSIRMYTKAIEEDKSWAAFAYYNRAMASLAQRNGRQDLNCLNQASEDLLNALKSVQLYCEQIQITQAYAKQPVEEELRGLRTRFDNQQDVRHGLLVSFMENILEAKMIVDYARTNGEKLKVKKWPVHVLAPLECVLDPVFLSARSGRVFLSRDQLAMDRLLSHPSFDFIFESVNLESVGLTHVYKLTFSFTLRDFFSLIFS